MKAIVILGYSRSGKDTCAGYINETVEGSVIVKFSAPMKRMVEKAYGLPIRAMEDPEIRVQKVPGEDFTYLDLMVKFYHMFKSVSPRFVPRQTEQLLRQTKPEVAIFVDIRNPEEVDVVKSLYSPQDILVCAINRGVSVELESDAHLYANWRSLADYGAMYHHISNNGTVEELYGQLGSLLERWIPQDEYPGLRC